VDNKTCVSTRLSGSEALIPLRLVTASWQSKPVDRPRLALVKARLAELQDAADARRAEGVFPVGSVARGGEREPTPERKGSDVDFYVVRFDVPEEDVHDAHVGLQLDYQQILTGYEVQVHRHGGEDIWSLRPDFEARMQAEGIELRTLV
jgi:predicted nucleotidyltransferase